MKCFAGLLLVISLAGCSYLHTSPSRTKADDLVDQAKRTCEQLGYPANTKEFVDCSAQQFNKLQEGHYGPLQ